MEYSLLLQKALKILTIRDHSVEELRLKLSKVEQDTNVVDAVIVKCLEMKYLDDQRFARIFYESLVRKGKGGRFIAMELKKRGVGEGIISETIQGNKDEEGRATEVAYKKFKTLSKDPPLKQQEKIVRFLQARGFSGDTCYRVAHFVTKLKD